MPPLIASVAKLCPAASVTLPVSEKVIPELVAVNVVHAELLHEPVDIVIVADANVIVAVPEQVRLLAPNAAVALVNVNVPENVSALPNVVLIAELTVTLLTVSSMETVPPETFTTMVDVPTVYVPAVLLNDVTVIVLPFAVRMPFAPIVTVGAVIARLPTLVSSAVVLTPSVILNVPPMRRPRVAMVNVCAVPAELVNVTDENSSSARFAPANVIVPPVAESKVTVPVPASHTAASVDAFVHIPLTVHVSLPKSIAEPTAEMLTAPVTTTLPLVLVRSPPFIVRLPAVKVVVPLAYVPPERVKAFVMMRFVLMVAVPTETVRSSNVLSVESTVMLAVASKVTIPVP